MDDLSPLDLRVTVSPTNKPFYSQIFSTAESKFEKPIREKKSECNNSYSLPTVLLTPSSSTFPPAEKEASIANRISEPNEFLTPTRSTSLPLKRRHIKMGSPETVTTLISPETKRPKLPLNNDFYLESSEKSLFRPWQITEIFDNSPKACCVLPDPIIDDLSPLALKVTVSPTNKPFYSPIFSTAEAKFEQPIREKERECNNNRSLPTFLLTPSSPIPAEEETSTANSISEPNENSPTPTRSSSLEKSQIKMDSFGTVTTIISPETRRPNRSCGQLCLNGHTYTYLGIKSSTRSTYCCIYRPRPMFILQEINPKFSLYSDCKVGKSKVKIHDLTPGQRISLYNSKQRKDTKSVTVTAKLGEPLIVTHSSYWIYRSFHKTDQT